MAIANTRMGATLPPGFPSCSCLAANAISPIRWMKMFQRCTRPPLARTPFRVPAAVRRA